MTRSLTLLLALLTLALGACVGTPVDRNGLAPPEAVEIRPIRASRPVVGLVLGAGGSRGFAHVGVIKALEAGGLRPDLVVGSSSGSVVAALYASGLGPDRLEEIALAIEDSDLVDYTLFGKGWVWGEALRGFVNRSVGYRPIEQLPLPFAVVATEAQSQALTVFNRGETGLAVRASAAVPRLFVPPVIDGKEYVDGGLASRVPASVARRMGADIVIAVDISRWRGGLERDLQDADVVIRPDVPRTRTLDFSQKRAAIAAGEAAGAASALRIRELVEDAVRRKAALAAAR